MYSKLQYRGLACAQCFTVPKNNSAFARARGDDGLFCATSVNWNAGRQVMWQTLSQDLEGVTEMPGEAHSVNSESTIGNTGFRLGATQRTLAVDGGHLPSHVFLAAVLHATSSPRTRDLTPTSSR